MTGLLVVGSNSWREMFMGSDRGFEVLRSPRPRFTDLRPYGPVAGSSTSSNKEILQTRDDDDLSTENLLEIM